MAVLVSDCLVFVSETTGSSIQAIKGQRRSQPLARNRQIAMWLARELTTASFPKIGRVFERDHSTVVHAVKIICELRETAPLFRRLTDAWRDCLAHGCSIPVDKIVHPLSFHRYKVRVARMNQGAT